MCSCAYAFVMFFLQLALNVSTYRVHVVPQKTLDFKSKLGLCNNNKRKWINTYPLLSLCQQTKRISELGYLCVWFILLAIFMWWCLTNFRYHKKLNFTFRILQSECDQLDRSWMLIGYVVISIVESSVFVSMKYFGFVSLVAKSNRWSKRSV